MSTVDELLRALEDADELVRSDAADQLGAEGHAAAAERLAALLGSDESALVRASAAESLGDLPPVAATMPVLTTALGDPDAAVRGFAANSLGLHGDDTTLALLETALSREAVPETRAEIHGARYRLGSHGDLAPLLALLDDENLAINVLNVLEDLAERRVPPSLAADRDTIVGAVARVASSSLLQSQAQRLLARLARA